MNYAREGRRMQMERVISQIVKELSACSFIKGIVLGGSRATGTATDASDIDIGIYYEHDTIDYAELNAVARALDDAHRVQLICKEGEWGNWLNCGGWLVVSGYHVDIILRDLARVKHVVETTEHGVLECHYQTGHPHAYIDVMYRGELASCKVLYTKDTEFLECKRHAEGYPPALKKSLVEFFLFEAEFSCMLAEKSIETRDVYYVTGHVFRAVSAMNQVLFAMNEMWLLNEKKAVFRIDTFEKAPDDYSMRVEKIFETVGSAPISSIKQLNQLRCEITGLWTSNVPAMEI